MNLWQLHGTNENVGQFLSPETHTKMKKREKRENVITAHYGLAMKNISYIQI